ncbi:MULTISPECIES: phage tail assembly protein [unclassified Pseudomonas]|uniref:phage tail assembly protein n=1 Tax=unclassified Pseudomonas TaxID=196821 RepID=UPI000A1D75A4|nr:MULTISPECIES: phage tail assembly protein [unclassified Pseudomonas]
MNQDIQPVFPKKLPKWLQLSEEGYRIRLRWPIELNGVKVDTLAMRAPCVRDVRAAQATSNGDAEQREISLFASLTQTSEAELGALKVIDYGRLQAGYFRLVEDDEV